MQFIKVFIKEYVKDLTKLDSLLAFVISFCLYYIFNRDIIKSFRFSILFVIVFLFFLNLTNLF